MKKEYEKNEKEDDEEETLYDTEMRCPTCNTPLYLQERDALDIVASRPWHPLVILRCICGQLVPFSYEWDRHTPLH
jgi:uncharacterized protein with PIN domain